MAGKKQVLVSAEWTGGLAFTGKNDAGQEIFMDSPIAEGGPSGPSPMQITLLGLAGCTAMDVMSILKKKRQLVTGFEVNLVGNRADEHPKYYTDIEIEFVVRGHGIDVKAVERAVDLSENKYCSVSANFKPKSKIINQIRVIEEE